MNEVEAVKQKSDIARIHSLLIKHGNSDYADIWKVGINVALRISDLLAVKYSDIDVEKRELVIVEAKTNKTRTIHLNNTVIATIKGRKIDAPNDSYLFQSKSNRSKAANKPYSRASVFRKFQEVGDIVGIKLGTESLRKTRGYMMYSAGASIAQIIEELNYKGFILTYIGVTEDQTLQTPDDFEL